jgi:hypothetical protein
MGCSRCTVGDTGRLSKNRLIKVGQPVLDTAPPVGPATR